ANARIVSSMPNRGSSWYASPGLRRLLRSSQSTPSSRSSRSGLAAFATCNLHHCLEGDAASKDTQATEQRLFVRLEQVVAPGDCPAQDLLTAWCVSGPGREHP